MVVVVVAVDDGDVEVAKKDGLTYGTTREIGQFSFDHINVYYCFHMTMFWVLGNIVLTGFLVYY
ncbi:hypothetical protein BLOT_014628 [Blomia tropicalis]|nr:hypothetical protein BLOT_014628 [Blomia tropicalis]